jgi:hypothetical protein
VLCSIAARLKLVPEQMLRCVRARGEDGQHQHACLHSGRLRNIRCYNLERSAVVLIVMSPTPCG